MKKTIYVISSFLGVLLLYFAVMFILLPTAPSLLELYTFQYGYEFYAKTTLFISIIALIVRYISLLELSREDKKIIFVLDVAFLAVFNTIPILAETIIYGLSRVPVIRLIVFVLGSIACCKYRKKYDVTESLRNRIYEGPFVSMFIFILLYNPITLDLVPINDSLMGGLNLVLTFILILSSIIFEIYKYREGKTSSKITSNNGIHKVPSAPDEVIAITINNEKMPLENISTHLNGMKKPDDFIESDTPTQNHFKKEHPIMYRILGLLALIIGYIGFGILQEIIDYLM